MRVRKLNTKISSRINRSTVLSLIHHHPLISRAQLAKMTGLDRSTITHILNHMLDEQLVEEVRKGKAGSRGGRCPILLQVRYDTKFLIAVDVGTQKIEGVITNLKGDEVERCRHSLQRGAPLLDALRALLDELRDRNRDRFHDCVVIGVTCPGVIDCEQGIVRLNLFHQWRDVAVAEPLMEEYARPVFLENDANAAAMGELQHPEAEGIQTLLYFFIRQSPPDSENLLGVGGAVVFNGNLWHGSHQYAGEVSPTVNSLLQKVALQDKHLRPSQSAGQRHISLGELLASAAANDLASLTVVDEIADKIGKYLSDLATFLDPESVIVYTHPPEHQEVFFSRIKDAFFRRHTVNGNSPVHFLPPRIGQRAMLRGVLALAQERIFVKDVNHSSLLFQ